MEHPHAGRGHQPLELGRVLVGAGAGDAGQQGGAQALGAAGQAEQREEQARQQPPSVLTSTQAAAVARLSRHSRGTSRALRSAPRRLATITQARTQRCRSRNSGASASSAGSTTAALTAPDSGVRPPAASFARLLASAALLAKQWKKAGSRLQQPTASSSRSARTA